MRRQFPFHPGVDDLIWYLKNKGLKLAMASSRLPSFPIGSISGLDFDFYPSPIISS